MPTNLVKTAAAEKAWAAAKAKLGNRYGKSDQHWATLVTIFKRLQKKKR